MKLTVLVDNNTIIDSYYLGEPGLSFYIEDGDKKILFDTGYSDVFMLNARKMGINIRQINTLVLSHGHNDHTGGLVYLFGLRQDIDVYAHPDVDEDKEYEGLDVGSPVILDTLPHNFRIHKTKKPVKISDNITFLGEIERTVQPLRKLGEDALLDDTALVYENREGIFIITGCSHSGIANIVEQAKKITGKDNILGIIGGFHMLNDEKMNKEVCDYFRKEKIGIVYPCHCTDLKAKIALYEVCRIEEIGVGTTVEVKGMKVLNFGSLNYDHVYEVDHFVKPKETMSSSNYSRGFGGKGLNQSIAMAKAGLDVYHAGMVGNDGQDFIDYLESWGVKTDYLIKNNDIATGHAIIEVCNGENCIILHGGANQAIDEKQIDETLSHFEKGDVLLIQNEISNLAYLIEKAYEKEMKIVFNTAPMNEKVFTYPLELVDLFVVNEVEGAGLAEIESEDYDEIIRTLKEKFPETEIVMTVGSNGSYYICKDEVIHQNAFKVKAVDTTAAGDTFTGFFLAQYLKDGDIKKALELASKASSITVQGHGAAKSIPSIEDLMK